MVRIEVKSTYPVSLTDLFPRRNLEVYAQYSKETYRHPVSLRQSGSLT